MMDRDRMTKEEQLYLAAIINANRHDKLHSLGELIKGTAPLERKTKGASEVARKPGPIERQVKLKELGKLIRGV